jgi:hypothetical protein
MMVSFYSLKIAEVGRIIRGEISDCASSVWTPHSMHNLKVFQSEGVKSSRSSGGIQPDNGRMCSPVSADPQSKSVEGCAGSAQTYAAQNSPQRSSSFRVNCFGNFAGFQVLPLPDPK